MNLNQVTVPSVDLQESAAFYRLLGLRLIVDALPRYVRFECPAGDSTLSLHRVEKIASGDGITLYFECENLDQRVKELEQAGLTFDLAPTDQSWLWREARLRDPDQHSIILYHAGKNRKNPPWRVDGQD